MSDRFHLETDFELRGDQPQAIDQLVDGLTRGDKSQVLLGVTGSGKILRATMKKIADGEEYAMPATIEDPAVLGEIGTALKGRGLG